MAKVQGGTLLAATALWHLLVLRTEALVCAGVCAGPVAGGGGGQPVPPLLLSQMWSTSRMLAAVVQATSGTAPQLPDRLRCAAGGRALWRRLLLSAHAVHAGSPSASAERLPLWLCRCRRLVSHATWLEAEQRLGCGVTAAQRRVLCALGDLRVPPSRVVVNQLVQDVAAIDVAVGGVVVVAVVASVGCGCLLCTCALGGWRLPPATSLPASPPNPMDAAQVRLTTRARAAACPIALLIRDPLRHLLRGGGGRPTPLGSEAARERILQVCGWVPPCAAAPCNCKAASLCGPAAWVPACHTPCATHPPTTHTHTAPRAPPPAQAAGWRVVALDAHTCLQLPRAALADELGALMMGDVQRSSLRFAA